MESSIAVFLLRQPACERLPTTMFREGDLASGHLPKAMMREGDLAGSFCSIFAVALFHCKRCLVKHTASILVRRIQGA